MIRAPQPPEPPVAYNKDQWIASFEGQLALLRPHLTARVLAAMSLQAWHRFGTADEEPVRVARELSKLLDQQAPAATAKKRRA